MLTFLGAIRRLVSTLEVIGTSHNVARHITQLLPIFRQMATIFRFRENLHGRISPQKVVKTKLFLSTFYGDSSTTEVLLCCEAATKKINFSITSVFLRLHVTMYHCPCSDRHF